MVRTSYVIGLASLVLLSSIPSTYAAKAKGSDNPTYQSIFQGYYDLASPHNRMKEFSFGLAAQFSTIMPFGRLGTTAATPATKSASYATFFNFHAKAFVRIGYYLETFLQGGYTEISTHVVLKSSSFQHAKIDAYPILLGFKYRILKSDFVPYVFAAGGMYITKLTASEEVSQKTFSSNKSSLGYKGGVGMEIFVQAHLGFSFDVGIEQIHHGAVTLGSGAGGFDDGSFSFKKTSGGVLLASSFFYEF